MIRLKRTQFWGEDENDDRLVAQIIAGLKTATACPADSYFESDGEYDEGGFEVDDLVEVYDLKIELRCIIRITEVYTTPFGIIPQKLWIGECFKSAEEFQQEHIACWPQYELTNDFLITANHFELVKIINR